MIWKQNEPGVSRRYFLKGAAVAAAAAGGIVRIIRMDGAIGGTAVRTFIPGDGTNGHIEYSYNIIK